MFRNNVRFQINLRTDKVKELYEEIMKQQDNIYKLIDPNPNCFVSLQHQRDSSFAYNLDILVDGTLNYSVLSLSGEGQPRMLSISRVLDKEVREFHYRVIKPFLIHEQLDNNETLVNPKNMSLC